MRIHDGKLLTSMDPGRLGPHPTMDSGTVGIPGLSEHQKAALEAVMESAKRNELRVHLNTGDILFVNNWAVLHRRDPYSDDEHTSRHLVRLWLRNNQMAWAIPQEMQVPWKAAYGRGEEEGIYSIYPMPEYKAPRYTAGSAAFVIEDSDDE